MSSAKYKNAYMGMSVPSVSKPIPKPAAEQCCYNFVNCCINASRSLLKVLIFLYSHNRNIFLVSVLLHVNYNNFYVIFAIKIFVCIFSLNALQ